MRIALWVLTALIVVVMVTMTIAAVWLEDQRWGITAYILLFVAIGTGGAASFPGWKK